MTDIAEVGGGQPAEPPAYLVVVERGTEHRVPISISCSSAANARESAIHVGW